MLSAKTNLAIPCYVSKPQQGFKHPFKFSWANELKNIFSYKFFNFLLWPVFKMRQRHFTRSTIFKLCRPLPGFLNLWKTIQRGSFAYNTLFLGIIPVHRSSSRTDLADITTLALFFGDEFIDGIRLSAGKDFILRLLNNNAKHFYLRKSIKDKKVRVEYSFELLKLLPTHVLEEVNPKYKISYRRFYYLLKYFLQHINKHLAKLPLDKAEHVADKIADACNTCLESYLHDINSYPEQDGDSDIATLLEYHELKTRYMQRKLLEVRCSLADREDAMHSIQSQGWINIMSVVQIYDDMQDIVVDDGFQDNLLLCTARRYFPIEWEWFAANKELLKTKEHAALFTSLYMPCSVQFCLQLASDKIITMNWEQQKITHFLLKKNWFIAYKNKAVIFCCKNELSGIYQSIKNKMQHLTDTAIKSYAVDICFHKRNARRQLLKKVNITRAYQLKYNLLSMSIETKAAIFNDVTKN